jgi:hypothetical protein
MSTFRRLLLDTLPLALVLVATPLNCGKHIV